VNIFSKKYRQKKSILNLSRLIKKPMLYSEFFTKIIPPKIAMVKYAGFRSLNFASFKTMPIKRSGKTLRVDVNKSDIEEITTLFASEIIEPLVLGGGYPGRVMSARNPSEKFSPKKFYGNDSFGDPNSYENFYLFPVNAVLSFNPEKFLGACAIALCNLRKDGIAIAAFNPSPINFDAIFVMTKYFEHITLCSKMIVFRKFKGKKIDQTIEDFIDFLRYYFEQNRDCVMFKKNEIDQALAGFYKL